MATSKTPVVAVITNYNMAASLDRLLKQVVIQGYHEIFVIDDASTDHSREVIKKHSGVQLIAGKTNVGSGANRNRILDAIDYEAIIHFIDADMRLISEHNVETAQAIFNDSSVGIIGGLIVTPDQQQLSFNYGPRFSLYAALSGSLQLAITNKPLLASWFHSFLKPYPYLRQAPQARQVFWVAEGNMLVQLSLFRKLGGFHPGLRYHEIQDMAIKVHQANYHVVFDPRISAEHPFMGFTSSQKQKAIRKASWQLVRIYGLHLK
jgi:glycosyltransferase involved in cell wall biosynthesis